METKTLTLKRFTTNPDGTFGVLIDNLIPFALTLEPPWANNEKDISCIPAGLYTCSRIKAPKYGETFTVENVPNRTGILFRGDARTESLEGGILVGEQFDYLKYRIAVLNSLHGFNEFLSRTAGLTRFSLLIAWC